MNKTARHQRVFLLLAIAVGVLVFLLVIQYQTKKQAYIEQRPVTSQMRMIEDQGKGLDLNELIRSPVLAEWNTGDILYNAWWYPDTRETICTVSAGKNTKELTPYLVFSDGTVIVGWYQPGAEQYGVRKIFFEDVGRTDIGWLDLIDVTELNGFEYKPEQQVKRVRFWIDPDFVLNV